MFMNSYKTEQPNYKIALILHLKKNCTTNNNLGKIHTSISNPAQSMR